MKTARVSPGVIPLMMAVVGALPLAAQSSGPPPVVASLSSVVDSSAAGERLQLRGTITVVSTITTADGVRNVSYSFAAEGTAIGQLSQANYVISGAGVGQARLDAPLPADVGFTGSFVVTGREISQRFNVLLQASLDAQGNLKSAVVREVASQ